MLGSLQVGGWRWNESGTLEICWRAFVCKCGRPSLGSTTAPKKQQNALSWRRHFPRPEWRDLALSRRLSVTVLATLKLWFSTRWSHLTLAMLMAWLMYISSGTPTHSSVGSSLGSILVSCLQVLNSPDPVVVLLGALPEATACRGTKLPGLLGAA